MIPTYIITREGRSYSTEGLEYVTEMLRKGYGVEDELFFYMGAAFNEPGFLAEKLDIDTPVAIIVSTKEGIHAMYNANGMSDVAYYLYEGKDTEQTSWEILCYQIDAHNKNE